MNGELRRLPDLNELKRQGRMPDLERDTRPMGRKAPDENDKLKAGALPSDPADGCIRVSGPSDPSDEQPDEPERPTIKITPDLSALVDKAIKLVAGRDVYQRHGVLVDVVRDADERGGVVRPDGTPRIRQLPIARLAEHLADCADWKRRKKTKDGDAVVWKWVSSTVPPNVVGTLQARGEWSHIRPLEGVVEWPVLRPDGSVLCQAGYDRATRLICAPNLSVSVPAKPTQEEARKAADALVDLVRDFPFETPAHRTSWLAMLLSLVARPAIAGPVPLGLLDATERGTGKTLLADLVGVIVTGRSLPRRTAPTEKAEWDKAMLAICLAADPIVLLDNVTTVLRSEALDAVLTGTGFRGRLLGKNEEISLPARTIFLATTNNAMLSADLVRRTLHVRLDARQERPEQRTGFKHADLLGYALAHRAELLGAALTILRAHAAAGRPAIELRPMGSFEAWSAVVRAALVWIGEPDPTNTQDALREGADTEREAAVALVLAWHGSFGDRHKTAADVVSEITDEDRSGDPSVKRLREAVIGIVDPNSPKVPTAAKLGYRLRRLRGKIVSDYLLETVGQDRKDVALWRVRPAGDQGIAGDHQKRTQGSFSADQEGEDRRDGSPAIPLSPADEERSAIEAEAGE